ncbi:hypothetical protein, partial [Streptomyces sp. NPDC056707]|uniref:hypothetical protein n=1 Tax=Streptomyces sp. NPDC056707 TaxID=3345919 RepID=UPI0036865F00
MLDLAYADFGRELARDPDLRANQSFIVLAIPYAANRDLDLLRAVADATGHTVWGYTHHLQFTQQGPGGTLALAIGDPSVSRSIGQWHRVDPLPRQARRIPRPQGTSHALNGLVFTDDQVRLAPVADTRGVLIGYSSHNDQDTAVREEALRGWPTSQYLYTPCDNTGEPVGPPQRSPWYGERSFFLRAHASRQGIALETAAGTQRFSGAEVGALLQRTSFQDFPGRILVLMACHTGAGNVIQEVADATGRTVYGPTDAVATSTVDGVAELSLRAPGTWRRADPTPPPGTAVPHRQATHPALRAAWESEAERIRALFGDADNVVRPIRLQAWGEFTTARAQLGRVEQMLEASFERSAGGASASRGAGSAEANALQELEAARGQVSQAWERLRSLGVDPDHIDTQVALIHERGAVSAGGSRVAAGAPRARRLDPARSKAVLQLCEQEWNAFTAEEEVDDDFRRLGPDMMRRTQGKLLTFEGELTDDLVRFVLVNATRVPDRLTPAVLADVARRPALLVRAVGRTQGLARVTARRPELLNVLDTHPNLTRTLAATSQSEGPAYEHHAEVLLTYPQVVDAMERNSELRNSLMPALQLVTVLEGRLEVIEPVTRGYGLPQTVEENPGLAQALLAARSPAVLARSLRNLNSLALAIRAYPNAVPDAAAFGALFANDALMSALRAHPAQV